MKEYLIVFAWGFVPATTWLTYMIVKDAWSQRWHQKFRGPKPDDSSWSEDKFHARVLEAFERRGFDPRCY